MRFDPNGAHARPSTTVRNAEGLVQVEMADVCSNDAWSCQPHLKPIHTRLHGNSQNSGGSASNAAFGSAQWTITDRYCPEMQQHVGCITCTRRMCCSCAALLAASMAEGHSAEGSQLAEWSGQGGAHLCIHVCTIHVHLPSTLMDDVAHLINTLLIHPMS